MVFCELGEKREGFPDDKHSLILRVHIGAGQGTIDYSLRLSFATLARGTVLFIKKGLSSSDAEVMDERIHNTRCITVMHASPRVGIPQP